MSDNPSNQVNTGVYGQLLGLATAAQGGRETDKSVNPLSDDERRWLDDAIQTFTKQADPIAHMKRGLAKLKTINLDEEDPEVLKEKLEVPVVELLDLVCDLDLALDFCTLGGVAILDDIFAKNKDISTCTILPLVTEIAQNNPPVQKVLLKSLFLEKTLNIFKDPLSSDTTKTRAVSAISCIVKQFPPAVIKFVQLKGHLTVLDEFHNALEKGDDLLVQRCVIALGNIGRSAAPELIARLDINIDELISPVMKALEKEPERFSNIIEYLKNEDVFVSI